MKDANEKFIPSLNELAADQDRIKRLLRVEQLQRDTDAVLKKFGYRRRKKNPPKS